MHLGWQYLVSWSGWAVPTWQNANTLSDAGEFVQDAMAAARCEAEDKAVEVGTTKELVQPYMLTPAQMREAVAQYGPYAAKEVRGNMMYEIEHANQRGKPTRVWVLQRNMDETELQRLQEWQKGSVTAMLDINHVCVVPVGRLIEQFQHAGRKLLVTA